jgi:hypothetical protein
MVSLEGSCMSIWFIRCNGETAHNQPGTSRHVPGEPPRWPAREFNYHDKCLEDGFARYGLPAAVLLAWEGASGVMPHALQRVSILYYLQSLCPVPAPIEADAPTLVRLLMAPAAPASKPAAILGLLALTAFVLWIAARAVRRMQISYGSEA